MKRLGSGDDLDEDCLFGTASAKFYIMSSYCWNSLGGCSRGLFSSKSSIVNLGLWCFIFWLFCPGPNAEAADALPAANRIDWSSAGVQGGIPHRTTIYTTLNPTATA